MPTNLKVRVKEKIYYVDAIREPGLKSRAGEPLDEFFLEKKEHFNPQFMEPLGWTPEVKEEDMEKVLLSTKEDGSHRTAEEIAFLKSDKLDEGLRKARASKVKKEQAEFVAEIKTKPEVL